MSLFEDDQYQWRETYFVLFNSAQRPTAAAVEAALTKLDPRYEVRNFRGSDDGLFESGTLYSPDDYAAMDLSYVTGDEVVEHTAQLQDELTSVSKGAKAKLGDITQYDARIDVMHFEQMVFVELEADDEVLDPGSLLNVIEALARLCGGVGVDPQSGLLFT